MLFMSRWTMEGDCACKKAIPQAAQDAMCNRSSHDSANRGFARTPVSAPFAMYSAHTHTHTHTHARRMPSKE